jgi:tight adherence protein C
MGFLGLLFMAVAGLAYVGVWLAFRPRIARERLVTGALSGSAGRDAGANQWQVKVASLAKPLAKLALPKEGWETSGLRTRFMNAGWRNPSAPILYFGAKAALTFGLPILLAFVVGISVGRLPWGTNETLFVMLAVAATGYYLPNLLLAWQIARRQRELLDAFPDAVDLIIVCIEAGLGLDAAIARSGQEMRLRSAALADELHLVGLELRVGASREQALRNLALRSGLDDFGALVTMLIQADRFGTSIAESLRVHAEGLRTRRRQRAEEAAAKLPLKLLFPLIFCIFPSLMLVLLGPAVISIYHVFLKTMVAN